MKLSCRLWIVKEEYSGGGRLTANSGILVAAVLAVGVPVALPRLVNATTVGLALELQLAAL